MAYVSFPSRRPRRSLTDVTGVLCVSTALVVSGDITTVAFWFDGWRHGVCCLLEGDMAYVAFPSRRLRRSLTDVTGVLCVSTALVVSGERDKVAVAFTFSN
ncbi:hypothetical protein Taro_012762, partial [Colocasia esculenta]|nr:hypothetical protein [Colocasia esculenta]